MGTVRIAGMVRLAQQVRRQLSRPMSPEALARLRQHVADMLERVDGWLDEAGSRPEALAAPSRKAYEFLRGVDWSRAAVSDDAAAPADLLGSFRLPGLRRRFELLLDDLSCAAAPEKLGELHEQIRTWRQRIDDVLEGEGVAPEQLREESRAVRAWLGYFSRREKLEQYVAAAARARAALEAQLAAGRDYPLPVRVHFRPSRPVWRLRADRRGTLAILPTAMVVLGPEAMAALAARAAGASRDDSAVQEAMLSADYQGVLAELSAAGGVPEQARGVHHDLAASFARVNAAYFEGRVPRPHLRWGLFTSRRFGHYDAVRDTVMVSSTLDRPDVPPLAVDYIVFHELLHKVLGVRRCGGRRAVHTPEFRRAERRFERLAEAQAVLHRLAGGQPPPSARGR